MGKKIKSIANPSIMFPKVGEYLFQRRIVMIDGDPYYVSELHTKFWEEPVNIIQAGMVKENIYVVRALNMENKTLGPLKRAIDGMTFDPETKKIEFIMEWMDDEPEVKNG